MVMRALPFNLVVTNVPGPQFPLYMMGRRLEGLYPMVPLAPNQAIGIAIMSYDGTINFGLVGDFDLMADLDDLAGDLHASLVELAEAAGVELEMPRQAKRAARRASRANGHKPGGKVGSAPTVPTLGDGSE